MNFKNLIPFLVVAIAGCSDNVDAGVDDTAGSTEGGQLVDIPTETSYQIPFTSIHCFNGPWCITEISEGIWTSQAYKSCRVNRYEDFGWEKFDTFESECLYGRSAAEEFQDYDHDHLCFRTENDDLGLAEHCYLEISPDWWVFVQHSCQRADLAEGDESLWGSWDSACYSEAPLIPSVFSKASCAGDECLAHLLGGWTILIRPSCLTLHDTHQEQDLCP